MIREASAADGYELAWFKSSYSDGPDVNSCVEVASAPGVVHVRDSKDIGRPHFHVGRDAWGGFVGQL
ncbi:MULTISPECIES: DUF397 domain-containing protein [Streptomyces]|uniref:DUF397 domain-containing protein n=1 Tax=Streptomyces doudnae TaxID=3075536 RepID=A0ABD5EQC4_9ACTN|nr:MULTISPECIES: DUF397 domain-containing protein [unclassified Streptomyces]MDT0436828.1 DUF397 domain-containing protein [Streptomyces sp. DSM 41981]MYQ63679.1 DUF397 domain-containing protein [Streptomyces sp. SID4950]SCD63071.1 protein of unknown function [Streptomyces sp. SolWspMP-5a-2]